jgi:hypothetical protein
MKLVLSALESWLWEAACVIRGPVYAPKFKDYILPLIFLKRVSEVRRSGIALNATSGTDFTQRGVALAHSMPPLRGWLISTRGCYTDAAPTELPLAQERRTA